MNEIYIKRENGEEVAYERGSLCDRRIGRLDGGDWEGDIKSVKGGFFDAPFGVEPEIEVENREITFYGDRRGRCGGLEGTFRRDVGRDTLEFEPNDNTSKESDSSDTSYNRYDNISDESSGGSSNVGGGFSNAGRSSNGMGIGGYILATITTGFTLGLLYIFIIEGVTKPVFVCPGYFNEHNEQRQEVLQQQNHVVLEERTILDNIILNYKSTTRMVIPQIVENRDYEYPEFIEERTTQQLINLLNGLASYYNSTSRIYSINEVDIYRRINKMQNIKSALRVVGSELQKRGAIITTKSGVSIDDHLNSLP